MKTILAETSRVPFAREVENIVMTTPVIDIHTHLYDPAFKQLLLWGIDDLLVYHYLVAESFRLLDIPYEQFWALSKPAQADLIWQALFLDHSPISEACRGVLTTLHALGLDVKRRDLPALRKWFAEKTVEEYLDRCVELAGLEKIYMTNSPFDDLERPVWERGFHRDDRFVAGLRIDPLLLSWSTTAPLLARWGYQVQAEAAPQKTFDEVRRFLADWTRKIASQLIEKAVLPHCREHGLPFALMPGVKRAVNPQLRLAGDGQGLTNLQALQNLCAGFPENKFMATVLARENQHELCVLARKF